MAAINRNRYRLITLLYVIFVCLSVLNIPATYLDSNYYSIKTLEYQERERIGQVDFANRLIAEQMGKLTKDTAKVYLNIQARIHKTYLFMDKFDLLIQKKLAEKNTTVWKEFGSKKKMEEIFMEDSAIYKVQYEFSDLARYLNTQPFQIDHAIQIYTPVQELVKMQSGKEVEWARYLFLHKPTAISYNHIKRLKLLLLDNENVYQNAALRTIGYLPAYYSEVEKRAVIDTKKDLPKVIDNKKLQEELQKEEKQQAQEQKELAKKIDSVAKQGTTAFPKFPVQAEPQNTKASNTDNFDEFIQRIITSLHTENFYVGIPNPVLKEFNYLLGTDFNFDIVPHGGSELTQTNFTYSLTFRNTGTYTMRFTDRRKGANKIIFEKKVEVFLMPNPLVKLGVDKTDNIVNIKDLTSANRLVASLGLIDVTTFPGRITDYRVTRISRTEPQTQVLNYGDVFQVSLQSMISKLQKGDLLLFDQIHVYTNDNVTRTANPLTYKIVD